MEFTVVIPAGGEGSRFRPYTDIVPKPMIPLGEDERPILDYIVRHLAKKGSKRIVLLVNYKWRYIKNYFNDGSRYNIMLDYSVDDDTYSNTGGSLLKAYKEGLIKGDVILIWYGDIIANLDPMELIGFHQREGADAALVIADRYQIPVGLAEVDNEKNVKRLREKPWLNIMVTIGVLTLKPSVLDGIEGKLGTKFDLMGDLIPHMIESGKKVKGFLYSCEWLDVGSLERYKKINSSLLNKVIR